MKIEDTQTYLVQCFCDKTSTSQKGERFHAEIIPCNLPKVQQYLIYSLHSIQVHIQDKLVYNCLRRHI